MNSFIEVVEPAALFVLPQEIRGGVEDDEALAGLIAAVTRSIAPPSGWLGRSLGEQTLRWVGDHFPCRLPYPPIMDVVSVEYDTPDGPVAVPHRVVGDRLFAALGERWPAVSGEPGSVRVTYRAGYEDVPAEAKHAVILAVQHLRDMGASDIFETQEQVVGVGSTQRSVTPYTGQAVRDAVGHLLAGLRVYRG